VPTIEQIARSAKAELDSDINLEVVAHFVGQKIAQVYSQSKFKALRRYGELQLQGAIGSIDATVGGTITFTPGSTIIIGDSTAAAAWNNTIEGWFLRVWPLKTWYRIARLDPPATITLDSPVSTERNTNFTIGVASSGNSYYIVQKFVPLPTNVRYLGVYVVPYLYNPLEFVSPEVMNYRYPSRHLVGPYPWAISEFGTDFTQTNKPKIVEVYPYPQTATVIPFTYWATPPHLTIDEELPPTFDAHVAREMAMIPILRYEYMRRLRMGDVPGAELLRNDFRAQESKAPEWVDDALKADSGVDDRTFLVSCWRRRLPADFDTLTTAELDVWARVG